MGNKREAENFIDGKRAKPELTFKNEFKLLLEEYVLFGGFPAIVKETEPEIKIQLLKALQQTCLEKGYIHIRGSDVAREMKENPPYP